MEAKKGRRQAPEGNSIMQKHVQAVLTPAKKKKKAELDGTVTRSKHKLSDDEWDVDDTTKRSRHSIESSEIEIDVDQSIAPQLSKKKVIRTTSPAKSAKVKRSKKAKSIETDVSWEEAVEKARGLPDGAQSEDEPMPEKTKNKEKKTQFEKGKKKPLNIISSAAKKLKKMKNKGDDGKIGAKRKRIDTDKTDTDKTADKEQDTSKKQKAEQVQKKIMRKKSENDHYELATKSKKIWNDLRRMDLPNDKRIALSNELYEMVQGEAKRLIFAHDTSRVIQCLIKYGTQEHKNALFEELKGDIVELCKSKYAKFFVRKLLKYGTKDQRNHVFQSLYGNIRKLIRHKEACEIIEVAYNDYANAQQRCALLEEFYGPSFALFKTGEVHTIEQIMESNPDKRDTILSNMKESLSVLAEKAVLQYSIVHRIFLEYFTFATEKLRAEMIEAVREGLIHMLHTRDGARVTMMCLWYGTPKDRKVIIKSMKTYVLKICKEEYGHMTLLSIFDCVDDTKIVQKVILEEMLKSVVEIAADQYGRKVLLYLLSPRDPRHFHPDIVKILQQGDNNTHSKKSISVRQRELLDVVSRPMVQYIAANAEQLIHNNAALLLILAVITKVTSDPTDAMRSIALLVSTPFRSGSEPHLIEQPAAHLTLKRLIQNDAERIKQGEKVLFSSILLDVLADGALKSWAACNRGCFTLCFLIELQHDEITATVKKSLQGVTSSLHKMEFKGAQVLLTKLG